MPWVNSFKLKYGYGTALLESLLLITSHKSLPLTIPSGLYSLASYKHDTNSFDLPPVNISDGSFSGNSAMCALPGVRSAAHSAAPLRPTSSISKQNTTFSNRSNQSIACATCFFAALAPFGTLTTGHLLSIACDALNASISPSTTTTRRPPSFHRC